MGNLLSLTRRIAKRVMAVAAILVLMAAGRAEALVINATAPGPAFNFSLGPAVPVVPGVSQSELVALVNAAGDYWESLIDAPAPRTVDIQVGFTNRIGLALAGAVGENPETRGVIGFNASTSWFLDTTPLDNSEYAVVRESFAEAASST